MKCGSLGRLAVSPISNVDYSLPELQPRSYIRLGQKRQNVHVIDYDITDNNSNHRPTTPSYFHRQQCSVPSFTSEPP